MSVIMDTPNTFHNRYCYTMSSLEDLEDFDLENRKEHKLPFQKGFHNF